MLPPSPPKPSAFSSAPGEKLKNRQQEEIEFDKDDLLTGFRFVDIELLVDFVKKLLCPACKRPLGQNTRLSHVTEHRTNQASKVISHVSASKRLLSSPQRTLERFMNPTEGSHSPYFPLGNITLEPKDFLVI